MNEHTPGPWIVGQPQWNRRGAPYKVPITAGSNGVVCVAFASDEPRDAEGKRIYGVAPEAPDNDAYLIAAAPDLLDACKAALHDLTVPQHLQDYITTIPALKAAIRKAENKKTAL